MTNKDLSQIHYLKKEIELNERRLKELNNNLNNPMFLKDNNGDAMKIQYLETKVNSLKNELFEEMIAIQEYINNIQDSLVRMIITLRFVECYSWDEVAIAVGGGNSYDGIKKIYYRYIKNN